MGYVEGSFNVRVNQQQRAGYSCDQMSAGSLVHVINIKIEIF